MPHRWIATRGSYLGARVDIDHASRQAISDGTAVFRRRYKLGYKVALEQDLSIGAIFRRNNYLYVPLILSAGPNGM